MEQNENSKWNMAWYDWLVFLVPVSLIAGLGLESAYGPDGVDYHDFRAVAHWFDPVFFQYNLVMMLLAVLVVPSLALTYIQTMASRKERRLRREIPVERRGEIHKSMERRASFSAYRGSVFLTTVIVLLGASILLLFKPVFSSHEMGVNFSLGANMLMMGPFAELFGKNPDAYYSHLTRSLTAFQFGFLGAYIYFIGSVARAYFMLDLTSHTFVDGAIRMIVASILALVLSFAFHDESDFVAAPVTASASSFPDSTEHSSIVETPPLETDPKSIPKDSAAKTVATISTSLALLPLLSFFFGFYPKRAFMAIERIVLTVVKSIPGNNYRALPLSMLAGMSYAHELRLEREGFDNIENLSSADAVDLAVRTCFSYSQLNQWINQAWLAAHLREDYPGFVRCTGITNSEELQQFFFSYYAAQGDAVEQLVVGLPTDSTMTSQSWKVKLTALKVLLDTNTIPPALT